MDESRKVFGIDLGTTYSCVSCIDEHDQAVVLQNLEGDLVTPSVVYFESDSKQTVGKEAKNNLVYEPDKTVCFIKREMCKDECFNKPTKHPYGLDPVEISSIILRKLVDEVNRLSGWDVKDVVITCPAYFGTAERERTKQAGKAANLNVIDIIDEPVAAAICYGLSMDKENTIMVYDLGGGTFDATIIKVSPGIIQVIATDGKHDLGGADWDRCVANYMLKEFNKEHDTDYNLDMDENLKYTFMLAAEEIKKALSQGGEARRSVSWGGKISRIELTRDKFDDLTSELLDTTITIAKKVVDDATRKLDSSLTIDTMILVGGSSRMPQVKKRVDYEFGVDAELRDPDHCVAKGAALYAMNKKYKEALKEYERGDRPMPPKPLPSNIKVSPVTVTSKTYGTDVGKDEVSNLIFMNTPLPAHAEDVFFTQTDGQRSVEMGVYESSVSDPERKIIKRSSSKTLSDRNMQLSSSYPANTPIKVSFDISESGLLSVHAEINNEIFNYELPIPGVRSDEELKALAEIIQAKTIK